MNYLFEKNHQVFLIYWPMSVSEICFFVVIFSKNKNTSRSPPLKFIVVLISLHFTYELCFKCIFMKKLSKSLNNFRSFDHLKDAYATKKLSLKINSVKTGKLIPGARG